MPNLPIAERKFTIVKNGTHHLEISVYAPVKDQGDYRCEYEIKEEGKIVREGHALGVDSLQAMILALQKLGADIVYSDYAKERKLFWNDQNDDLGLVLPRGL
jgi:hypothetical protein